MIAHIENVIAFGYNPQRMLGDGLVVLVVGLVLDPILGREMQKRGWTP